MRVTLAILAVVCVCDGVVGVPSRSDLSTELLLEDMLSATRRILEPEIQSSNLPAMFSTQLIAELRHRAYNLDEIGV